MKNLSFLFAGLIIFVIYSCSEDRFFNNMLLDNIKNHVDLRLQPISEVFPDRELDFFISCVSDEFKNINIENYDFITYSLDLSVDNNIFKKEYFVFTKNKINPSCDKVACKLRIYNYGKNFTLSKISQLENFSFPIYLAKSSHPSEDSFLIVKGESELNNEFDFYTYNYNTAVENSVTKKVDSLDKLIDNYSIVEFNIPNENSEYVRGLGRPCD